MKKKQQHSHHTLPEESVWDYPRPARCEPFEGVIVVEHEGEIITRSQDVYRVIETSHPPSYYLAPEDVAMQFLHPNNHRTLCEWKGRATYYDLVVGGTLIENAAWTYHDPTPGFAPIHGRIAFYPNKLDACWVNGVRATAQKGGFYGGWITPNLKGPFKGAPDTMGC